MIGLVTAAESFVSRHNQARMRLESWNWQAARRAAGKVAGCDILCFGDSLTVFGVQPKVLKYRTGRRAFNLALCQGSPAAHYFLLRRALESGARPSAVIVEFTPQILGAHPLMDENHLPWGYLAGLLDCLDLAWTTGEARTFWVTMLDFLLPSFRERHTLRYEVMATLAGQVSLPPPLAPLPVLRRNWYSNRGAWVIPAGPPVPDSSIDLALFRFNPATVTYVEKIFRLADRNSIQVFWLLPPNLPSFQARLDSIGLAAQHTRLVRQLQARNPNVIVIDGRHSGYDNSVFMDIVHMTREGGTTMSLDVADILERYRRDRAPGSRWINLPAYRQQLLELSIEDFNQSRSALHLSGEGHVRR
jgi:hypothetical protein